MELNKRQKPQRALQMYTIKLCILIIATAFACVLPQPVHTAAATEDNKSGLVADGLANLTNDQKDRDRLSSVSPFPDNHPPLADSGNKTLSPESGHISNISTISNGNDLKEVLNVTTTTTTTAAPLIPPATVNAAIAQMNSSASGKKKGQIIIR